MFLIAFFLGNEAIVKHLLIRFDFLRHKISIIRQHSLDARLSLSCSIRNLSKVSSTEKLRTPN